MTCILNGLIKGGYITEKERIIIKITLSNVALYTLLKEHKTLLSIDRVNKITIKRLRRGVHILTLPGEDASESICRNYFTYYNSVFN